MSRFYDTAPRPLSQAFNTAPLRRRAVGADFYAGHDWDVMQRHRDEVPHGTD